MFTICMNRFHYQDYLAGCKDKGIEPKARPPAHFKSDDQFVFMLSLLPWCLVLFFPGRRWRLTLLPLLWRNHLLLQRPAWTNFYWSSLRMPIWWVIIYQLDKIFVSQSQLDSHFDLLNINLFTAPSDTFVQHLTITIFHEGRVLAVPLQRKSRTWMELIGK